MVINKSLILLIFFVLSSCSTNNSSEKWTKQNLGKASTLSYGMTEGKVINIMGNPIKREFSGNESAWNYCKTDTTRGADEFVLLLFKSKKLVRIKNYTVTLQDTGGVTGDCSKFVRPYLFKKPNNIGELRIRKIPN